jgi:hypothetical protein
MIMEFLAGFFTSLFANNLVLSGKGVNLFASFATQKTSHKIILFGFYVIAAVILGLVAYLLAAIAAQNEAFRINLIPYQILILVGVMVVLTLVFVLITKLCHLDDLKSDYLNVALNTSLLAIGLIVLSLQKAEPGLILANIIGLPVGFLLSVFVFEPIADRIEISDAPTAFKGIPLLLISTAALLLACYSLKF